MTAPGDRQRAHFRAHERRLVQLRASIFYPGTTERDYVQVLNMGLGGAGIACRLGVRADDRVMMTILSPALLDPLTLPSRVAWSQAPRGTGFLYAGVAFEPPDRNNLLTLFQLIGAITV